MAVMGRTVASIMQHQSHATVLPGFQSSEFFIPNVYHLENKQPSNKEGNKRNETQFDKFTAQA